MLGRINELIIRYGSERAFRNLILKRYTEDHRGRSHILQALKTASESFEGQSREDGKPIISHPINVALILLEYLRIRKPEVISAALLHLFIEDVPGWDYQRLMKMFGFETAIIVWCVSKRPDGTGLSWEVRTRFAHLKLQNAPVYAQMLKLCDRLHNLMTIASLDAYKRDRMLKDTLEFYVPLAQNIGVLEAELQDAISMQTQADY